MVATTPVKSVEGWIIICTNLHEEVTEEDLLDLFGEYGHVNNIHLNLDRRTGYAKGYALLEYGSREESDLAVSEGNGQILLDKKIEVSYAFTEPSGAHSLKGAHGGRDRSRSRSLSPSGRRARRDS